MKYICDVCGWEYDEAEGYPEGGIFQHIMYTLCLRQNTACFKYKFTHNLAVEL